MFHTAVGGIFKCKSISVDDTVQPDVCVSGYVTIVHGNLPICTDWQYGSIVNNGAVVYMDKLLILISCQYG